MGNNNLHLSQVELEMFLDLNLSTHTFVVEKYILTLGGNFYLHTKKLLNIPMRAVLKEQQ